MRTPVLKRSLSLTAALLLSTSMLSATPASADDVAPVPGATVREDLDSPTGQTVTFVYKNADATRVQLAGDLTLLKVGGDGTRYAPEEWQAGMYHSGGVEFLREMVKDDDGYWSVSIPAHAGALSYWYRVWDPTQGWENKRIWDPASDKPRPGGNTTFRNRNNDVLDAVYVPYHEKQGDPILEERASYEVPPADPAQRGTVQYVPYTTILGDSGYYLGVYLPPGYDPNRAEPYKVLYLAHGIFGDETDWMVPANAPVVLDNMIAKGEIEPTVVVTMGNHFTGSSLGFGSYNRDNAADNLVNRILPFVEGRYNVADDREGRAYGGFSYGGMTSAFVMRLAPTAFAYYGMFSGNPSLSAEDFDTLESALDGQDMTVFLGNGTFEGPLTTINAIADDFREHGIVAGTAQVPGAHDGMTASQLFTIFARDYLWQDPTPTVVESVQNVTDVGSYGQQVVATVLEYPQEVDASELDVEDFVLRDTGYNFRFHDASTINNVVDREIVDVYTVADPALLLENERPEAPGRYVVIEAKASPDAGWTTKALPPMWVEVNPNQPTQVVQVDDVFNQDGQVQSYGDAAKVWTVTKDAINRQVDQFVHGEFTASVGAPLQYDYRLPESYDPQKSYPMVVALPGYGQGYNPGSPNARVHLTTDMLALAWASHDWIGRAEDVIVLAPQNRRTNTANDATQTAELIEAFSADFAVDTSRVYATSVSYGSTLLWWLFANRPELFAGGLLTGGFPNNAAQANAIASAGVPIWITHGTNDHLLPVANAKASYNRIVSAYEALGVSQEQIDERVKWTEYGAEAFTLPDPHLAAAPTLEDASIMQWLLDQQRVDKSEGADVLAQVEGLDEQAFTTSTWAAVAPLVEALEAVLSNPVATQAEADAATQALSDAIAALAERGDPRALSALISASEGLVSDLDAYTSLSGAALQKALAAATAVYADRADKTQAEIDAAGQALQSALAGLRAKAPVVDYSVLQHVYDSAKKLSNKDRRYTKASWSALQSELGKASKVLGSKSASQEQVNQSTRALSSAVSSLVPATIKSVVTKVKLSQKQLRLVAGKSFKLRAGVYHASGKPSYSGAVKWKSSDRRVATVTKSGKIKAKRTGTVKITVTSVNRNKSGKKVSTSIKVRVVAKKAKAKVTSVSAKVPTTLRVGQAAYVTGKYKSAKATSVKVTYSSSKPSIVSIDKIGRIEAKAKGEAKITIKAGSKTKTYRVKVR